ncbi:ATP-binding protein [Roseobacter litoralis]|uniref:histidine kinase n=1 Tax=Roseobacter litoralis (strain ATCC 49566 / DSM 6996 / JCM 21268 / NBRC 15278 / OCh 149) TaxID=391595 RepID=F7ZMH8_ROSLO|nr:ATP-binding protein [Roseobacter litoralis]AEI96515.1 histidine kinase [Roseobacter litoralis Och 149]
MKRMGFRTQIAILVVSVLFVAQVVGLWLFVDERSLAVQAAIGSEAAGRAANVARLIEEAPSDLRQQIVVAANSPLVRFDLENEPAVVHTDHNVNGAVEARIRALLNDEYSRDIRVEVHEIEQGLLPLPNLSPEMAEMHAEMMQGTLAAIEMEVSISIAGGQWLNVATRFERPPIQWSWASTLSFVLTAGVLLLAIFWFLLTRLTRPLNELAAAAEEFGRGGGQEPLTAAGPNEVRNLTMAFNEMQARLARFVSDRTQMLAALAHDLRSPLTALRVHAEMVEDPETKSGMTVSLDEMQDMVEATLAYARGVGRDEHLQAIEITEYLTDIKHQTHGALDLKPGSGAMVHIKPVALRRALRNLIDNAQRYGCNPTLSWRVSAESLEIVVDDDGPGIPEDRLRDVFQPFLRLEQSRSHETGGHGLGLSIARSIVLEHGGTITLSNRKDGGLCARVALPMTMLRAATIPTAEHTETELDSGFSTRIKKA